MLRSSDLTGKVALVTGASTGIGAAVANAFGKCGMHVAVHFNASRDAAETVAAQIREDGGRATLIQGDVGDAKSCGEIVRQTAREFGGLDILVNNAGSIVRRSPIRDADDELFESILNINARSVFLVSRAAIPMFEARGRGNIINTTSVAARGGGGGGSVLYAGAKGFVSSFTRGLAKELATKNIRVNAVAPGVIQSPLQDKFTPPDQIANAIAATPMGRVGTTDECIGAYLFLASDNASSFVTGQVIEVNGGLLIG
jgi:3-oxoacyl-[acyl-carrier protein] reductase